MDRSIWAIVIGAIAISGCGRQSPLPTERAPNTREFAEATPLVTEAVSDDAVQQASYDPCELKPCPNDANYGEPLRQPPPILDVRTRTILMESAKACRARLAVIADNLANAHTPAFKRSRVIVENTAVEQLVSPGILDSAGQPTPTGVFIGRGMRIAGMQTDFRQGPLRKTDRPLDLAIEGIGFFQVTDPSGEILYTRAGMFSVNANNQLVLCSAATGRLLEPAITIPSDALATTIHAEGTVFVQQPSQTCLSQVGQITLAMFVNPEGLRRVGENLYEETDASNSPTVGNPGQDGLGTIRQGYLESSNVDPQAERSDWIETTRHLQTIEGLLQGD